MEWLAVVPVMLVTVLLLVVPGYVLGRSIGLRGLWLWALAPLVSTTLFVTGSIVLPLLGLSWNPVAALGFAVVFASLIFLLFKYVLRTRFAVTNETGDKSIWASSWSTLLAWGSSATILVFWIISGIGLPENISQTFDNVFHLNAIAFIAETGSASSFDIGALTSPGNEGGFYPVGWHALVALVEQATGVSVAVAINGFNLAVASVVWPLGMLILVRQLAGQSHVAMLLTGIFAAALPVFPMNMLYFGVLYPYFFGLSFLPVVVAVILQLLGVTRDRSIGTRVGLSVLLLGLLPGLSLSHPVALMTVLAISVPIVLVGVLADWRSSSKNSKIWRLAGLAAYGLIGYVMLYKLRPGVMWAPRTSTLDALWRTFSLQLGGYGLPLVLAALTLFGIIVALSGRERVGLAAVGMWGVIASLHFVVAGVDMPILRGVTGVWYGDTPRIEAAMPAVVIPLAVMGGERLFSLTRRFSAMSQTLLTAGGLVLLLLLTQLGSGYSLMAERMQSSYASTESSVLLSNDERALLDRVRDETGAGEMIVGSPWTGTSLAFAFAGREVIMPHILMQLDGDRATVMNKLRQAEYDPAVCRAVNELNVRWLLDFGDREVHGAEHVYAGLDGIENTDLVELVDSEGDARLYRIIACS